MEQFSCGYCSESQIVQRRGGTISLKLIGDAIKKVQIGTDKTAAELAIKRLRGELESVQQRIADSQRLKDVAKLDRRSVLATIWSVIFVTISLISVALSQVIGGFAFLPFFVFSLASYGGFLYYLRLAREAIDAEFDPKIELLVDKVTEIQIKINKNRQLVD